MSNNKIWDVDEFHGKNKGLWIAEVELESENEEIVLPKWVEKEVTYQKKYYNAYLSKYPFISWNDE